MKLKIGISPCPNDTFIFEALCTKKIIIPNVELEFSFHDIAELNELAAQENLDIAKISFAQLFAIENKYNLLQSGGAMGFGVGPLLLAKNNSNINLQNATVAIPGEHTTANSLLTYLYPKIKNKVPIIFSKIEEEILNDKVDAGLVIHESRFTFKEKGLIQIADLGELWQHKTSLPIPLGCIVASKKIPLAVQKNIESAIVRSIEMSWATFPVLSDFVKHYAQEMNEVVMRKHIELYVNNFSKNMGDEGLNAINKMREIFS